MRRRLGAVRCAGRRDREARAARAPAAPGAARSDEREFARRSVLRIGPVGETLGERRPGWAVDEPPVVGGDEVRPRDRHLGRARRGVDADGIRTGRARRRAAQRTRYSASPAPSSGSANGVDLRQTHDLRQPARQAARGSAGSPAGVGRPELQTPGPARVARRRRRGRRPRRRAGRRGPATRRRSGSAAQRTDEHALGRTCRAGSTPPRPSRRSGSPPRLASAARSASSVKASVGGADVDRDAARRRRSQATRSGPRSRGRTSPQLPRRRRRSRPAARAAAPRCAAARSRGSLGRDPVEAVVEQVADVREELERR